jgi:uncharacterized membrane protein
LRLSTAAILSAPLFLDGTVQISTSYLSNGFVRFATGLLFGIGVSMLLNAVRGGIRK